MAERQILACSGGLQPTDRNPADWQRGPLFDYALRLTGRPRPKVCFLATATGDDPVSVARFYGAFAGYQDAVVSHLTLFAMPNQPDPAAHLLAQDLIWVGGGSVANLMAVWRTHRLDEVMRAAWEQGVVLAGSSAGSICWHRGGTTDSFGPQLRVFHDGLGLLPYANGVHHDSEPRRRPLLHQLVADRVLPAAFATDDGVGLHYRGEELVAVLSDRPGAAGYRVQPGSGGGVTETRLPPQLLP